MKRTIIIMIALVLMSFPVLAEVDLNAQSLIPVEIEVSVDFQDTRDFRLLLPNGYEKHFYWDSNETHSDSTFKHTVYHTLNEDVYCTQYKKYASECKSMNTNLTKMLDVCADVVQNVNNSQRYQKDMNSAIKSSSEYEKMWGICEDDRKDAVNDSEECNDDLEDYKNKFETCDNSLSHYKGESTELVSCQDDLTDCDKAKKNSSIIWFLAGLGAGFFLWGKSKGKGGPSEQAESGYVGDSVQTPNDNFNYNHQEFHKAQSHSPYDEGPRE